MSGCGQITWQQGARERGLAPQVPVPLPRQKGTGTSLRSEPVPICPPENLAVPSEELDGLRGETSLVWQELGGGSTEDEPSVLLLPF